MKDCEPLLAGYPSPYTLPPPTNLVSYRRQRRGTLDGV